MAQKKPTIIRVSNLARTLRMIESMTEEITNEGGKAGADLVIRLIRKEYGITEEDGKE
jgi:CRISPR/Cas system CMR-associated protein Cmr5 small subunit